MLKQLSTKFSGIMPRNSGGLLFCSYAILNSSLGSMIIEIQLLSISLNEITDEPYTDNVSLTWQLLLHQIQLKRWVKWVPVYRLKRLINRSSFRESNCWRRLSRCQSSDIFFPKKIYSQLGNAVQVGIKVQWASAIKKGWHL